MVRVSRLLGFLGLLAVPAGPNAYADMVGVCRDEAMIAEHSAGIPEGLLLAIGKRESGRFDPQTGSTLPWPWSVNRDGQGAIFGTEAEAVTYVADAQRAGSRSIDVGCFQINLKYHPGAFASLQEAFDPAANAAYAARFLRELYDRDGSWEAAVADYHSATPWFGEPYRDAVLAIWHGISPPAELAAGLNSTRVVMGIHIFEPAVQRIADKDSVARTGGTMLLAYRRGKTIPMIPPHPVNGLPVVITPDTVIAAR
jgi:Transglycosylase SLT domain